MNARPRQLGISARCPRQPRGSIYVLVLGCAVIVFVVGVSSIALAHVGSRSLSASRDWNRAGVVSRSAIEVLVAAINRDSNWRTTLSSGTLISMKVDGVTVQAKVVDETDGDLSNNATDPARIYALAFIGSTRRVFSAEIAPTGSAGLDLLRCPVHSNQNVTTSGTLTLIGGPISSNNNLSNTGVIQGDADVAGTYISSGRTTGYVTNPAPLKTMPPAAGVSSLFSGANTINFLAILGGQIKDVLLSANSNPYGSTNSSGMYVLTIAPATTLTITESRIKASVLINLSLASTLVIKNNVLWESADPSLPALVVVGPTGGAFKIDMDGSVLSESGPHVNFNPPGTPYQGISNATTTDTYTAGVYGVVHIIGPAVSTSLAHKANLTGCLVSEGPVTITETVQATADPTLPSNPPQGYANGAFGSVQIVRGSFRWETADIAFGAPGGGSEMPEDNEIIGLPVGGQHSQPINP